MTISLVSDITLKSSRVWQTNTIQNTTHSLVNSHISMPGGQFSHFRDKMSLARDTGQRGSIPGRSRPFRDGWQPYSFLMTSATKQMRTNGKWGRAGHYRKWYGIEFNVPLDTVYVISETGGPWAVMCISHSVMDGQRHNNPLNPRCFRLQQPKRDGASS